MIPRPTKQYGTDGVIDVNGNSDNNHQKPVVKIQAIDRLRLFSEAMYDTKT